MNFPCGRLLESLGTEIFHIVKHIVVLIANEVFQILKSVIALNVVSALRNITTVILITIHEKLSTETKNPTLTKKFLSKIKSEGNVDITYVFMEPNGFYDPKNNQIVISEKLKDNPFVLVHEYGHHKVGFIGKIYKWLIKKYPQLKNELALLAGFIVIKFLVFLLFINPPISKKLSPLKRALLITLLFNGATLVEELVVNLWTLYRIGKESIKALKEGIPQIVLAYATYLSNAIFDFLEMYILISF